VEQADTATAGAGAFRAWTEGVEPPLEATGGPTGEVTVTTGSPGGGRSVFPVGFEELPVAFLGALDLGPRPVPEGPTVRLSAGAMAVLIGRRQAHGHGLPAGEANALQQRLDPGVRHWTVRLEALGGRRRRNLEVLEGEGGIWRVHPTEDGLVELAPASATTVVRDLVALLALGRSARLPT